ncbi:PREDICTED: proprotein convertase subtilisin/kexin type 6 isoform X4 [Nanorana parkeri]|uniref:proprotein convertase subtilisin/kexin type 6 isoform X4 n=1 Tax=Nanorana parkeri TaxID=125878 RepID=UPI00085407F7|nr:PREDICTED: proprotein convertase subtilisin/kexin type 6 isoform X4 [Nanorana parkeri]
MLLLTGPLLLLLLPACLAPVPRTVYSNHWAVRVPGGTEVAAQLADKYGYLNLGKIGSLENYYHFYHSKTIKRSTYSSRGTHSFLQMDPNVKWMQQQQVKKRVKRHIRADSSLMYFNDPIWSNMWYLHCGDKSSRCRSEMNVMAAWQRGYTGKNVVVSILDDGVEKSHPDLIHNYDPYASHDVNGDDQDPSPRYDASNENKHGTRCAGEVAASANNSYCIVGIAYNARIGGIRMLDGDVTDVVEAKSLGIRPDYIDIYSASWGPDDDGKTVDGPGPLAKKAFEEGIKKGRKGLGSIYVWASGNGGREGDYCSCDGYTNSVYTISISSTTENGYKPWYLEECASTLSTTYSSGAFYERKIVTTDLRQRCTDDHTGTSVSAPMVAGVIALALEAKFIRADQLIRTTIQTNACTDNSGQHVAYLEHVVVRVTISHPRRGDLQINLISPSGTKSQLLARRTFDYSNEGFKSWEFMTVHCWGEKAEGEWMLEIHDIPSQLRNPEAQGRLKEWTLILYGTDEHPYNAISFHNSRSKALDLSAADQEPSKSAVFQNPLEFEEEDEYSGTSLGYANILWTCPCHTECGDRGCDGAGADQCLNCVHYSLGSVKSGRKCVSTCPSGFMVDVAGRRCRRCHRGCESCFGRSQNQCSSCKRGFYVQPESSSCTTTCSAGAYADESLRRCLKCHQNCKKCLGYPDKCVVCREGFSLSGSMCVPECEPGTFFNTDFMKCDKCHSTCQSCVGTGKDQCTQCTKDYHLHDWRCVPTCSTGFYSEAVPGLPHKVCRKCEENCLMCEATGKNCVRCKEGYSLLSGSCVTNHTCSNADDMFCEMVKSSKLCERKLFIQFCCRTCMLAG